MNWSKSMPILSLSKVRHQSGAALMVVLLILLIMSLLSTSLVSNTVVGSRLAANKQYLMQLDMTARSAQARVMAQLSTKIGVDDPADVSGYSSLVSGDDISATLSSIACIEQVDAGAGQWHSYWDSELTVNHSGSGAQVTATAGFRYTSNTPFDEENDLCIIPSTAASISVSGGKMVYLYFHHID